MISSSYLGFPPMFLESTDNDQQDDAQFEVDEYLSFDGEEEGHILPVPPENKQKHFTLQENTHQKACSEQEKRGFIQGAALKGCQMKIAFKTKSDIEILDDGYKWRKYGKKMVKNSPHPRNYYQCANKVCSVKKRVERQREDSRYVITTYEGVHNHHPLQMQKQIINTDLLHIDSKTTLQMEQCRRHY
ncbi:hypothetical protein J5N97_019278 [Dioscorea zingiberensis]|uniref:WRKY domain-containing protein n=1 Tax=Dioscorea zingiberensis TaxID=325984 RepID=A0A9D5CEB6_9LILI|nr:hypothetical protein J5N97_019278 [Dioscorea zingiberensis]